MITLVKTRIENYNNINEFKEAMKITCPNITIMLNEALANNDLISKIIEYKKDDLYYNCIIKTQWKDKPTHDLYSTRTELIIQEKINMKNIFEVTEIGTH